MVDCDDFRGDCCGGSGGFGGYQVGVFSVSGGELVKMEIGAGGPGGCTGGSHKRNDDTGQDDDDGYSGCEGGTTFVLASTFEFQAYGGGGGTGSDFGNTRPPQGSCQCYPGRDGVNGTTAAGMDLSGVPTTFFYPGLGAPASDGSYCQQVNSGGNGLVAIDVCYDQ